MLPAFWRERQEQRTSQFTMVVDSEQCQARRTPVVPAAKAEAGGLQGQSQPGQYRETLSQRNTVC